MHMEKTSVYRNKKCQCEFGLQLMGFTNPDGEKMGHVQVLCVPLHDGVESIEFTIHHKFGESHIHRLHRNKSDK